MSVSCWDVETWIWSHNCRRTQAIASTNVGCVLPYHAVLRTQVSSFFDQQMRGQCNDRIEAHQRRGGTGNGPRIPLALRFHPQMRPRFFHVTSMVQRRTNQVSICAGVCSRWVDSKACGLQCSCGSRIRTQRMATGGLPA